jgi:hypothetical protein
MTSGYPELLTNLLIFLVFFIFSYHISASPLDLHEIPENQKLKDLIIYFFKRDKINYNSLDNDEPGNIISDLLDDSPEKTSSKNRFCDKMFIPVYLFFIYILYFITLLLILFLKPYPFSKSYILTGHFLNVYNDSQNSTMIFHPHYGGFNYAKKHIMESEFKDKFREVNVEDYVDFDMMGKSFAVDSNSPLFEYNVQQYIEKPNLTQIINVCFGSYFKPSIIVNIIKDVYIQMKVKVQSEKVGLKLNVAAVIQSGLYMLIEPYKRYYYCPHLTGRLTEIQ